MIIRILLLIFFFLFITKHNLPAQNNLDSLIKVIENYTKEDSIKVTLLIQHAWLLNSIDPDSCYNVGREALELSEKIKFSRGIAGAYNTMGIARQNQGDYSSALELYFKSLEIYENSYSKNQNNKSIRIGMGNTYNNIGVIYQVNLDYERAMNYYKKALDFYIKIDDKGGTAATYNNLGSICYDRKEFDHALEYFFKSLEIDQISGDKREIARNYHNIGAIYLEKNELELTLLYQQKAFQIQREFNDKWGMTYSLYGIGYTYGRQNNFKKGIENMEECIKIALEIKALFELKNAYEGIANMYEKNGNYEKAFINLKKFKKINDSLFNDQKTLTINELHEKYESEKKEQHIEMLEKDKRIQDIELKRRKFMQYSLVGGFILLLVLSFFIYNRYTIKRKSNQQLELKNAQLENINSDLDQKNRKIAESINYAQRIQETILPAEEKLNKFFEDSFVFYKPKDVVSGDFPWVWQNNSGYYLGVVDCTGHGVPGAMMSMVGHFLLNDIMKSNTIDDPALILNKLHKGVNQTLNQNENIKSVDGMDVALCKFNNDKTVMQFSGAHRPVLIVNNGKITEIKGDRIPVGGIQYSSRGKDIQFNTIKIPVQKGDLIFLFSDGITDQIGGEFQRKYKLSRLIDLIKVNENKSMFKIKETIDSEFYNWKGDLKQIDDVLIIGVRV